MPKDFIVAIELGSSKMTGIAGKKNLDGSIQVLAVVKEESSSFIRKGYVYNIDKTAQCLTTIVNKLEKQLKTSITQVYVGVGGQSIRSIRNVISKEFPEGTVITQDMVIELMDANRNMKYPDQEILDAAVQEYKVDSQYQLDPVGIQCSHIEGNFLNILQRKSFYKNLNLCFEAAGINVAEMYLAPLALADSVLTETEKRSGCVLVDLGADTTTVSVYFKNVLRHLAVIPLGGNNITKDIASLQMEETDAERMKLKYAEALTDNNDIDNNLKYSIDTDRQVESRKFIEIVEGRLEEIIANVWCQVPEEYYDKLLGGIILTGGGANMKDIEKAFVNYTRVEKIRTSKFVTQTIVSNLPEMNAKDGQMNTVLGLLAKGDINCAGQELDPNGDLFATKQPSQDPLVDRKARTATETPAGVVRTAEEIRRAEEEARLKREEEERIAREKAEEEARKEAERRRENSFWADNILLDFGEPERENSIIKVIGVGGGGGNAVNHMYREGIHDVTFVLCNTDNQALNDSPVPVHLQLGKEGLGAGNKPEKARAAAEESIEDIKAMLSDGTRMAFITAGMGGGTGTGAAPVIARISKEMGILTVGIVTIPFRFEGDRKIDQALDGVEEMAKHVDALLVINNERLREIYPELSVLDAFGRADDTLSVAAKSIAEIITVHGLINLDFNDVKTVLKDGGVAIMSTGYGEGEGRVKKAIDDALNSPLLNDNDVFNSKKILLSISFAGSKDGKDSLMMEEMNDVNEFMAKFGDFEIKWGLATDPDLGKKVKVTILATGFGIENVDGMNGHLKKHSQDDLNRIAEEQEKAAQKQDRRNRYYGGEGAAKRYKRRPNIYLFRPDDLDNDDVISAVEQTPTYKRTREILDSIYSQASGEDPQQQNEVPQEPIQGTIVFS